MGLYENIKKAASEKGVTIKKLEQDLGWARSSISKFNTNTPSVDKIAALARRLNVSMDSIYYGETERDIADVCAERIRELSPNAQEAVLDQIDFQKSKENRSYA